MLARVCRALGTSLLVWCMLPGTGEALEQLIHLVRNGHLAHSVAGDADEGPLGSEHDCQGTMHLCRCCPSSAATVATRTILAPTTDIAAAGASESPARTDPHLLTIFHPPRSR